MSLEDWLSIGLVWQMQSMDALIKYKIKDAKPLYTNLIPFACEGYVTFSNESDVLQLQLLGWDVNYLEYAKYNSKQLADFDTLDRNPIQI